MKGTRLFTLFCWKTSNVVILPFNQQPSVTSIQIYLHNLIVCSVMWYRHISVCEQQVAGAYISLQWFHYIFCLLCLVGVDGWGSFKRLLMLTRGQCSLGWKLGLICYICICICVCVCVCIYIYMCIYIYIYMSNNEILCPW